MNEIEQLNQIKKISNTKEEFFLKHLLSEDQRKSIRAGLLKAIQFPLSKGYLPSEIWIEFKMYSKNQIIYIVSTKHGESVSTPYYSKTEIDYDETKERNTLVEQFNRL